LDDSSSRDLNDRIRTLEALRPSEERYRLLFEVSPAADVGLRSGIAAIPRGESGRNRSLHPRRTGDTVSRLGGDEFAFLVEGVEDAASAGRVADRVQRELSQPFEIAGQEVFTSASIGISLGGTAEHRPEDLLRDADTAMYRAKAQGIST
jgi:PAS domain-containing protein